jgi:hypothetical protein
MEWVSSSKWTGFSCEYIAVLEKAGFDSSKGNTILEPITLLVNL